MPNLIGLDKSSMNGGFESVSPSTVVRATLHHLDGRTSQIELRVPKFSAWGEYEESASMMLKEYCNVLAARWVQISKFQIEMGSYDTAGVFEASARYKENQIPNEKVFVKGKSGEWMDYAAAYIINTEAQCIALEKGGRP